MVMAERSGVVNLHLAAEISTDASKMTMLYKIAEGPVKDQFYGLALAKLVDLPPEVLDVAQDVSGKLNQIAQRRHSNCRALTIARKRNLILSLREQLLQSCNGTMEGEALRKWLTKLQNDFLLRMASIDDDISSDSSDTEQDDIIEEEQDFENQHIYQTPTEDSSDDSRSYISQEEETQDTSSEHSMPPIGGRFMSVTPSQGTSEGTPEGD